MKLKKMLNFYIDYSATTQDFRFLLRDQKKSQPTDFQLIEIEVVRFVFSEILGCTTIINSGLNE